MSEELNAGLPDVGEQGSADQSVSENPNVPAQDDATNAPNENEYYLSSSEAELRVEQERRHFQASADRRVAEAEKKAQQEIAALKAQLASTQTVSQPTAAQVNAQAQVALDAGYTQEQIINAIDNGTFASLISSIAGSTAEQRTAQLIDQRIHAMQEQQRFEAECSGFRADMDHVKAMYKVNEIDAARMDRMAEDYMQTYGHFPDPRILVVHAMQLNFDDMISSSIANKRTPPTPPTRPAPPVIGGDGSNIPNVRQDTSVLMPGAINNLFGKH